MIPVYLPETSCTASKVGAIAIIKALQPDPKFKPDYDVHNGDTAWRFSDYCRRHGYEEGRRWTEHILNRELKMRKRVYPRFVFFKRIKPEIAEQEIAIWAALCEYFKEDYSPN